MKRVGVYVFSLSTVAAGIIVLVAAFGVLREINVYGDPLRWTIQKSPMFTARNNGYIGFTKVDIAAAQFFPRK